MRINKCSDCQKEHTTKTADYNGRMEYTNREKAKVVLMLFTCDECHSTFTGKKGITKCQNDSKQS